MQQAIKTLIYFVIGFFLLIFILFILSVVLSSSEKECAPEVQYVEITGKNGDVKLHIGMIKDSVEILAGKPDQINIRSLGNIIYEDWGYINKNDGGSYLDIDFENGKIKAVRQY